MIALPRRVGWIAVVVGLFAMLMQLPFLGTAPLTGTEAHRAVTAHQMVASNQYLVPMLYGRVYLRKPPLQYWVLAGVEKVTGVQSEWAWRVPSALFLGLTAAAVALAAGRWWSPRAAWIGGLLVAGMVAIWAQSRSCDIDALNTLLTTATALLWIELLRRDRAWIPGAISTGVLLAGVLAAKGPAGLPVIVGVVLAGWVRSRFAWRYVLKPVVWLPTLIGTALAGALAAAIYWALISRGLPLDFSGINEGVRNLYETQLSKLAEVFLLVPQLLVFSLPGSIFLVIIVLKWREMDDTTRLAAGSVILGWAVCVLTGMVNPRYAYPTLPMLAAAVAGTAAAVLDQKHLYARATVTWAVIIALLAAPLAWLNVKNRQSRSGFTAAATLRQIADGHATPTRPVLVFQMLRYQPELLYYSGVPAQSLSENMPAPSTFTPGTLILASVEELAKLRKDRPLPPEVHGELVSNGRKASLVEVR